MTQLVEPHVHLWTRGEYYRMAEAGLFAGKRVELIEGQVLERSPLGALHATAITLAARLLEAAFGPGTFVRQQMPFDAGEISEPEPDVAVIAGNVRDYAAVHPTSAALILEVADTSLTYDRTEKARLYARAGIEEYWIVNLAARQLEVYRQPVADGAPPYGFQYRDITILTHADSVTPLARPGVSLAVANLLP